MKTPVSLLARLREPNDKQAWDRFVELYTPMIWEWLRRLQLEPNDASDLLQEVFVILLRKLPEFRYQRDGSFRGWLRTIVANKHRDHLRRRLPTAIAAPEHFDNRQTPDPAAVVSEKEYRELLVARALQLIQVDFQTVTWQAFWDTTVREQPAEAVAVRHGISVNAVYLAKSRVLRRLREELEGFLDE